MYRPWMNRKFGVELEMKDQSTDRTQITERILKTAVGSGLQDVGVDVRRLNHRDAGYYHSNGQHWDVKTDSSCGWEIASPALTLNADAQCEELKGVCDRLERDVKPQIDRTCGLHVHVEVRDFTWEELRRLLILWARYEPFFFELLPTSRSTNHYCAPFRKSTWTGTEGGTWTRFEQGLNATNEREFTTAMQQSYRGAINLNHFWQNRRVEFRLGSGTINYEKIAKWVQLLLSVVQRSFGHASFFQDGTPRTVQLPAIGAGAWSSRPFPVPYIAKVIGLAPSTEIPAIAIPDESKALVQWIEERRAHFQRRQQSAVRGARS